MLRGYGQPHGPSKIREHLYRSCWRCDEKIDTSNYEVKGPFTHK